MFNYVAIVEGLTDEPASITHSNLPTSDYGLTLYSVRIPAASSTTFVAAAVLTVPGIVVKYQEGDVVIVAELEQASEGSLRFFILGKLQTLAEQKGTMTNSLARIKSDEATLDSGTLSPNLAIVPQTDEDVTLTFGVTQTKTTLGEVVRNVAYMQNYTTNRNM